MTDTPSSLPGGGPNAVTAARESAALPTRDAANNVVTAVRASGQSQPRTKALQDMRTGVVRTFGELSQDLDETAAALRHAGLQEGDRVAVFVSDAVDFITVVFACFQAGLVPVLIDPGMGVERMCACIREQAPKGLVGVAKAHVLKAVKGASFASVTTQVLTGGRFFPGARALSSLKKQAPRTLAAVTAVADDDVAAVLFTSGSTGAPKGVLYTHRMLRGQAEAIAAMFNIKSGEVDVCCFLPFALFSVAMGMTAVFPDMDFKAPAKAQPKKVLEAFLSTKANSAFASPALWEPFARFLDEGKIQLPSVSRILTAGAPVSPTLHERFLRALPNGDTFTPYGATEALPVAFMNGRAVLAETAARTRAGAGTCVGTAAPGVSIRIIAVTDDAIASIADARAMPTGEWGEIIVSGPCVTRAYDNRDEANRLAKIKDGAGVWHRMGDLGYLDEQGRLWFCGRKAHRVETERGTLTSLPVEAVAETAWPARAALVWRGTRPAQHAVVLLETASPASRAAGKEGLQAVREALRDKGIVVDDVRIYPEPFPVDRRHNAKIEREALAEWLQGAAGGSGGVR